MKNAMHPRQASKIEALEAIGNGCTAYPVFVRAASFGYIRPEEFTKITGYKKGLRWAQDINTPASHATKDHAVSRKYIYDHQCVIKDLLSIQIVCALIQHAQKYTLGKMPRANHALWLGAIIAGHPANSAVMSAKDNSVKGARCSLTLPELAKNIVAWEIC